MNDSHYPPLGPLVTVVLALTLALTGTAAGESDTKDFLTPPADAAQLPSGIFSQVLTAGTGETYPSDYHLLAMHFIGWTPQGDKLYSSYDIGKPLIFTLDQVMPAFAETVQLMVAGEKRRVWIPGPVAGGNWVGSPKGPLVFEIELVRILPEDALKKMEPAESSAPPGAGQS